MVFPPLRAQQAIAAVSLFLLSSCGAGIVGAVVGADDGSNNPAARNPALTAPQPVGPLFQEFGTAPFRRVIVSDVVLPPNFTVELRALGATSEQPALILSDPSPQTTVVGFFMQTSEIVAASGDPTLADVDAVLAVLADGAEVAPPIPFTLLRQPTAVLVPPVPSADNVLLTARGGGELVLRVGGLRSTVDVDDLDMLLVTLDPSDPQQLLTLECTNLQITAIPASTDLRVSAIAPGSTFPGEVLALVTDTLAGSTPAVSGVYYRPVVGSTSPGAGPTDGGTLVNLLGTAMVPLNFNVPSGEPAVLDYDQVSIVFSKGGREVTLLPSDLRRDDSSQTRLVFPMPPSPDGLPGPVGVVLSARLGAQVGEDLGRFFYGDSSPTFGPRGALLDNAPIAIEMALVEGDGTAPNPVLLNEVGGVPVVQLYGTTDNGMFHRFGLPVQAGDINDPAQRAPIALTSGLFDTGPAEDLLIINAGQGNLGRHTLVASRGSLTPVLVAGGPAIVGAAQAATAIAGDLNGDNANDVVILPGPQAVVGAPEVFLAVPSGFARPDFVSAGNPPVGNGPFQAIALDDLDGDQIPDLILAAGGVDPQVVTAYGLGDGQFEAPQTIDLTGMVGYLGDPQSGAVGVHACGATPKSIAVVFAGIPGSGATEPTVAVLSPSAPRSHLPPDAAGVVVLSGADTPLAHSVVGDLDSNGLHELVVGASGDSAQPLRLLVWSNQTFVEDPAGVDLGIEPPAHIIGMYLDRVSSAATPLGLFVSHRVLVDGIEERRLSTWLVDESGPSLSSADASSAVNLPIRGVASGNFSESPLSTQRDLALASSGGPAGGEVVILRNDGLGRMSEFSRMSAPGMLPETLTARALDPNVFMDGQSGLAYLRDNGTLEALIPVLSSQGRMRQVSYDLVAVLPAHLQGLPVSAASSMAAADVDGDGNEDVVALLRFDGIADPGEGDAVLVLLRGLLPTDPSDPPLLDPVMGASVHGNASCFALGDLVLEPGGRLLEAAVAVPAGSTADPLSGNHVRFFRYDSAAGSFVRSFASARESLLAGSAPRQLRLSDFSGNGVDDIVVSSGGDSRLRLFVNNGIQVIGMEQEVNVDAFTESSAQHTLPPGEPSQLVLSDLNGDSVLDVVVATSQQNPDLEYTVAYYLRDALGTLDGPFLLPMSRTGNRVQVSGSQVARNARMAWCVTDFNGDGRIDMAFGWDTAGPGDRNLRMLFGGSR